MSRSIGDRNGEAATLAHIARLERDLGNMAEARSRIEDALAAVESLRINVKSHQLRASFFASIRNYHEFNVDLLMRMHKERPSEGFAAAALQASEKMRARSLLELLAEARAEIRRDIDPALIERGAAVVIDDVKQNIATFSYAPSEQGLPPGRYRVDLHIDNPSAPVKSLPFTIE